MKDLNSLFEDEAIKGLIDLFSWRLYKAHRNLLDLEDIQQELRIHLFKNIHTFDETKSKLTTYVYQMLNNKTINMHRDFLRFNTNKGFELYEDLSNPDMGVNIVDTLATVESFENRVIAGMDIDRIIDFYERKHKAVYVSLLILLRKGYSKAECSRQLHISKAYVTQILKTVKKERIIYAGVA